MKLKNYALTMIVCWIMLFAGCGTKSMLCDVPEAENSVICKLSQKMNTTPGIISQSLLVANFGALEADLYTAQKANEFIDKIINDIEELRALGRTITYIGAINYIDGKYKVLPDKIKAVFVLINPAGLADKNIKMPLTDYDFELILRHLNKQKQIIQVYL
jgi:hypothetical protein